MNSKFLESERLILKPLSFKELVYIKDNDISNIEIEAVSNSVKSAVSKKLSKMKYIGSEFHEWYTYWLIISKNNEKGIGFIGFKGLPDENGYLEVGYSISPNHRKKRIMTEALKTLVTWASEFQDCRGIIARVLKSNIGSHKVLTNCNFKVNSSNEEENNYTLKLK
ncbi:acetyltransferase [Clostridium carboxidivorans P7]|uniref:GCN5-related N-acetyltransferase n=1 Tax=Clostridium carboxidivorans P7 TaxID=536227 RepID=C6PMU1_9CLOT|nr:GNAT family N-acetyltransferase [Clostridium carboxidivorans]AKN29824.1 acetyltransferase [Clostridium carboxidivorans P7]EET89519.1 GCN5-related N-acetyltransferase [Clostridium carboxidivorans P7]